MKFQIRDKVKIINAIEECYIGLVGSIVYIDKANNIYTIQFPNSLDYRYFAEQDLELVEQSNKPEIRKFDSGATRDNIEGKLDYMKALSPIVLRRYVQYLDKHRLQSDGSMRDFNNWKKGIPLKTYHSSKGRHFFAAWLLEEGYEVSDNHGPVNEEDALCGELFNTIGRLHELLKVKLKQEKFVVPEGWVIACHSYCGWYVVCPPGSSRHLRKNLTIQSGTGFWGGDCKFGEAPGYWPTEEAAKDALKQYLEKK